MAKNSLENASDKKRSKEEVLKKATEEVVLLRGQVGALGDGPGVSELMDVMMRIDLNLQQAQSNIQNERKFSMFKENADKGMVEARAKIQRLGGGRSRKPASPKPKEDEKTKKDLQTLEAKVASENTLESKTDENHYEHAAKSLKDIKDYIKNHKLEVAGTAEAFEDFQTKLTELFDLLTNPDPEENKKFKGKYKKFIEDLDILDVQLKEQLKQMAVELAQSKQKPVEKPAQQPQPKPEQSKQEVKEEAQKESGKESYEQAKINLREFFAFVKKYNLSVGKKTVDDLNLKLKELSTLTAPKQYENFKNQYNQFNETLENLLSQLEKIKENKAQSPDPHPQIQQEVEAAFTEKQERKEEEERVHSYDKHEQNFVLLGMIIRAVDKMEGEKRKLVANHGGQMKALQDYLDIASDKMRKAEDSKVFWVNINNFNNGFKEALANLESDLKEFYRRGVVPKEEALTKEAEPVTEEQILEEKPVPESKKENLGIKEELEFVAERKIKLKLVERILRQGFEPKKDEISGKPQNYDFDDTKMASKIKAAMDWLNRAEQSLSKNDWASYEKNIDETNKVMDELWDALPAKVVKEYHSRMAGKETVGTAQEKKEREEKIAQWENSLTVFEQVMDEKDKSLRAKFVSELKAIKDDLFKASGNLDNADICEEYIDKAVMALGRLTSLAELREVKNGYYAKLVGTKREVATETVAQDKEPEALVPAEKRITAKIDVTEVQRAVAQQAKADQALAESVVSASTLEPEKAPKKKGLWGRIKDVFSKDETKKAAKKVTYDTGTSVLGVKFVIDAIRAIGGKGDIAEWWRGGKESKASKDSITMAFQDLVESLEKSKGNKVLAEHEKIENRIANFKAKVESANISPEAKQALLTRLFEIANKNREETAAAAKEKNKELQRVLDAYLQAKVTGVKIARDFLNTALTASGFLMLRGIAYAGASIVERFGKARKSYTRQETGKETPGSETGFVISDFAKAAIETAHALVGQAGKKDVGGVKRAVDAVKAWGIVLRGFGIYGVAISGAELPQHSFDKLIAGIKEQGIASTVSDNFIHNVDRVGQSMESVGHLATHPTEIFESKGSIAPRQVEQPEHVAIAETNGTAIPAEVPAEFSVDQFAAENNLSPEFAHSLDNLVHQYPGLNNSESMRNILDASQVGGGAHSHHEIIKSKIDTLDEGGGERRQVIFEELLKPENGGPESAANYLQSQNFSSRHLGYLSKYIGSDSPDEYLKFAQQYNDKDDKMVYGLFRAMQGKESTTLANAGLEGNGVDSHARGKINYFGVEDKKPVLSGSGEVRVVEESFVTRNKGMSPAATQNEGLSTDDKLWANANVIRSMNGGAGYDGSSANAAPEDMSAEERAVLAEVEGDKERFARLGERHIDILDRANSGQAVGEYINNTVQPEAPGAEPVPAATESVAVRKVINTYKASEPGTVVETKSAILSAESKPIVPAAEKPLPLETAIVPEPYADAPLNKFLQEHGSNQKEFFDTLKDMRNAVDKQMAGAFVLTGGSDKFLKEKLLFLHETEGNYKSALQHGVELDKAQLGKIDKLINVEDLYRNGKSGWEDGLDKAVFNKEDVKVMQLLRLPHPDADLHPILANGSHAVRVWNAEYAKDVFYYDKNKIYSLDKDENLIYTDEIGRHMMTKADAITKANE